MVCFIKLQEFVRWWNEIGKNKKVDDVKKEVKVEVQEQLVMEEPEFHTTFTIFTAEEIIDEERSVENVSN